MRRIILLCVGLMVSMFLLTACGGGTIGKKDINLITSPHGLQEVMKEFQELPSLKGKEIRIFQTITVGENYVMLEVVKPGTEEVDHYEYRQGKWGEPEPVQLSGETSVMENSIPINEYDFSKAAEMVKLVENKLKADNITDFKPIKKIIYIYNPILATKVVDIPVETTKAKYHGEFTFKGEFVSLKKE